MSRFYTGSFPTIPQRTDLISGRYALAVGAVAVPGLTQRHADHAATSTAMSRS